MKPTTPISSYCLPACLLGCLLITTGCDSSLKPFTSDGCSAFPDGTLEQKTLWLDCCTTHDRSYWRGGTYQQRLQADQALQSCVAKTGQPEISQLMLAGVRVGGTPYLPTTFRWGYGWPYLRSYQELSAEDLKLIDQITSEK